MKLVGHQPETVVPQLNIQELVPLFVAIGFCFLAVGIVFIQKFINRKNKSTEVEDFIGFDRSPTYHGLPAPPIYSSKYIQANIKKVHVSHNSFFS